MSQNLNDLRGSILRVDVSQGAGYTIPSDNPLVGSGNKEEIFAWGFRNPWRFTFDMENGSLWLGDVGPDTAEEVNRVVKGGNYGWNTMIGSSCRTAGCNNSEFIAPIAQFDHSQIVAIIGGYVYRGTEMPSLRGKYIFGNGSGNTIWSLTVNASNQASVATLFDAPIRVHGFSQANNGELFFFRSYSARIYKMLEVAQTDSGSTPQLLSETGCLTSGNPPEPVSGVIPYQVNTKLWSDGADKRRWMAIPDESTVQVDVDGDFQFPIGSVLIKEFSFGGSLVETRLLVYHEDGSWGGYSYEWSADGSDASLVPPQGKTKTLSNGIQWTYPSREQCFACHSDVVDTVLGLEIAQLNGNMIYPSTGREANQLSTLAHIGYFRDPLPGPVESLPALSALDDETKTVEHRARSYLHANCAGCHQPSGPTPANWDARYSVDPKNMNVCDVPPEHGDLGVSFPALLKPGHADQSVLFLRTQALDSNRMPPLATNLIDYEATDVLQQWINSLHNCDNATGSNTTVYEDAEDGSTSGWTIFDADPPGASIQNIYDTTRASRVIALVGSGTANGFKLDLGVNKSQFVAEWSSNFAAFYSLVFDVNTTAGKRYMIYQPYDTDGLGSGANVVHGLGKNTRDGKWHTFVRDLQADLEEAQPGVTILEVTAFKVNGNGRVDDLSLRGPAPVSDRDGDGISDEDELQIYGTNPDDPDSDGDSINDGDELAFWGDNWSEDFDGDGLNNLLDADSDNDGFGDAEEIGEGTDPGNPADPGYTVYEDAEDGSTSGWIIFDADPPGASIDNIYDATRASRVIALTGRGTENGFKLDLGRNNSQFMVEWSSNFAAFYSLVFDVNTTAGKRYMIYQPYDTNALGTGANVVHGLGKNTRDGKWHTFVRNLQADLNEAQPGVTILEVTAFKVNGNGRVDDLRLLSPY